MCVCISIPICSCLWRNHSSILCTQKSSFLVLEFLELLTTYQLYLWHCLECFLRWEAAMAPRKLKLRQKQRWLVIRDLHKSTAPDRIIETKNRVKCPGSPRATRNWWKNKSEDYCCPGILSCPGKKVSIIEVSIILFVTAKREFPPFFCRNS